MVVKCKACGKQYGAQPWRSAEAVTVLRCKYCGPRRDRSVFYAQVVTFRRITRLNKGRKAYAGGHT